MTEGSIDVPETMIERVGEVLRKECLAVFGSTWSYDVAWRFAEAAIEAMREPTKEMFEASKDYMDFPSTSTIWWEAMINAAGKRRTEKMVAIDKTWTPMMNTWGDDKKSPADHKTIQIFRDGWEEPLTMQWDEIPPAMNMYGLYWRPAQVDA